MIAVFILIRFRNTYLFVKSLTFYISEGDDKPFQIFEMRGDAYDCINLTRTILI